MALEESAGGTEPITDSNTYLRPLPDFRDLLKDPETYPEDEDTDLIKFVKDLTGRIQWMNEWVLKKKIQLAREVAEIYGEPGNIAEKILTAVAAIFIGIVGFVIVSEILNIAVVKAIFEKTKGLIENILSFIRLDWIVSMARILAIVWPQFRVAWKGFYQALGALSQTLGSSISFIPLLISNIESVAVAGGKLIGRRPRETRLEYIQSAAEWTQKIVDNLESWAAKPEKLMDDLYANIMTPWANITNPKNINVIETIIELEGKSDEFIENIDGLAQSVNRLVMDLPEGAFAGLQEEMKGTIKVYNDFVEGTFQPWQEITDIVVGDIQEELNKHLALIEVNGEQSQYPLSKIISLLFSSGNVGDRMREIWAVLTGIDLNAQSEESNLPNWEEIIAEYGNQIIPEPRPDIIIPPEIDYPSRILTPSPTSDDSFADTVNSINYYTGDKGPYGNEPWGVKV